MGFEHTVLHSPLGIIRSTRQAGGDPDLVDDYLPWLRQQLGRDATHFDHGVDSNSWVARPWDKPEHTHPTNFVAGQAADFLRRRDPTRPFFLYVSFNAPHPPYDPPAWAMQQYLDDAGDHPQPSVGDWAEELRDFEKPGDPTSMVSHPDEDQLRRARAGYWGHMTHVDQQINFLLEELSHRGLRDNTYILFTSDHGELLGDHHLFRKGAPYEGSAAIPMLLSGPGVAPGQVRDEVVELGDVMPTLLDCVGAEVPAGVDGSSMLPLVTAAGGADWRDWLHGEHTLLGQSLQWLTDGHEKYVWFSGSGYQQLFDLDADPGECRNLAADPAHASRVGVWRDRLIQELTGREEGFSDGTRLITGRPVSPVLGDLRDRVLG